MIGNYWTDIIGFNIDALLGGTQDYHVECAAEVAPTWWGEAKDLYDESLPDDSVAARFAELLNPAVRIATRSRYKAQGADIVTCAKCGKTIYVRVGQPL